MTNLTVIPFATRAGIRVTSDTGCYSWAVFDAAKFTDDDIRDRWETAGMCVNGFNGCAGQSFAFPMTIRRVGSRALAMQFSGLDV